MYDVAIVGGSFAGQSAALQLARTGRNILIIDNQRPRNRFAQHAHGFLGQDGQAPSAIMAEARRQLARYSNAVARGGTVESVEGEINAFMLSLADGEQLSARRLVLAYGVRDTLPRLPGLETRWGRSVLHCPYCHGFEFSGRPLGVLGDHPMSWHQAMLVADWGPTTYFVHDGGALAPEQSVQLAQRGVQLEMSPIVELVGRGDELEAVRLDGGHSTRPSSRLAQLLDCELDNGPTGPYVQTDDMRQTSVPGVFAAGDLAMPMANASLAASSGVIAGVSAHRSLVFA